MRLSRAAFLVALIVAGCGAPDGDGAPPSRDEAAARGSVAGFPRTVRDDAGRDVLLPAPPERIVSLVPSATTILLALGQESAFVGRTDFDDAPALSGLPSVGGGLGASTETIVSLRPDLVVRFDAASDPHTPRQLDAAGVPHLAIRPDGIDDVFRIIGLLGEAVGRAEAADSIRTAVQGELDQVSARVAGAPRRRVAILGGNPPLAAGPGTFLHELVEIAGGTNALADAGTLYSPVSVEVLLSRDLDLLLVSEGTSLPSALHALPSARIPPDVELPGLGLGASARTLAEILHPDRFR
jgi:iron complex transport system substrate-binding protein